jgi:hypothetical protein
MSATSPGVLAGSVIAQPPSGGDELQLVHGLPDERRERPLAGIRHPSREGDLEDRDAGLGRQARRGVADATQAQGAGGRRGERGQLDELTLLKVRVRGDDRLALAGELVAVGENNVSDLDQRRGHRLDRRQRGRGLADLADQQVLQRAAAREQDLALIGEMPEERSLRQPGPLRDLGHGRGLEPPLEVQLHGRRCQASLRIGLPSTHAVIVPGDDSDCHDVLL